MESREQANQEGATGNLTFSPSAISTGVGQGTSLFACVIFTSATCFTVNPESFGGVKGCRECLHPLDYQGYEHYSYPFHLHPDGSLDIVTTCVTNLRT